MSSPQTVRPKGARFSSWSQATAYQWFLRNTWRLLYLYLDLVPLCGTRFHIDTCEILNRMHRRSRASARSLTVIERDPTPSPGRKRCQLSPKCYVGVPYGDPSEIRVP